MEPVKKRRQSETWRYFSRRGLRFGVDLIYTGPKLPTYGQTVSHWRGRHITDSSRLARIKGRGRRTTESKPSDQFTMHLLQTLAASFLLRSSLCGATGTTHKASKKPIAPKVFIVSMVRASLELSVAWLTYYSLNRKLKPGGTSRNSTCWPTTSLSLVCRLCTRTSTAPKTTRSAN
jgi:hypothetical protein